MTIQFCKNCERMLSPSDLWDIERGRAKYCCTCESKENSKQLNLYSLSKHDAS